MAKYGSAFPLIFLTLLWPILVEVAAVPTHGRADSRYTIWPSKDQILYYLDPSFTSAEKSLVRLAAVKVAEDANACVGFVETNSTDSRYKIHVTPSKPNGDPEQFCSSYPGMVPALIDRNEQPMVVARGDTGCINGPFKQMMALWVLTLGRRNEHQRADRDQFIQINYGNLTFQDAYRLYAPVEADMSLPYDYCSITHSSDTAFAKPDTLAFSFKQGPQSIPDVPQLSNKDCQSISLMYGCDPSKCAPILADCDAAREAALSASDEQEESPSTFSYPNRLDRTSDDPSTTEATTEKPNRRPATNLASAQIPQVVTTVQTNVIEVQPIAATASRPIELLTTQAAIVPSAKVKPVPLKVEEATVVSAEVDPESSPLLPESPEEEIVPPPVDLGDIYNSNDDGPVADDTQISYIESPTASTAAPAELKAIDSEGSKTIDTSTGLDAVPSILLPDSAVEELPGTDAAVVALAPDVSAGGDDNVDDAESNESLSKEDDEDDNSSEEDGDSDEIDSAEGSSEEKVSKKKKAVKKKQKPEKAPSKEKPSSVKDQKKDKKKDKKKEEKKDKKKVGSVQDKRKRKSEEDKN